MDFITFISLTTLFYGTIYFIDQFLKSCMNLPYLYFLENVGLKVQPFQINIFSTILNRPIAKLALNHKRCFRVWFSIGAICVVLLLFPSLFLLISNLISQVNYESSGSSQQVLQPVVPGINLPVEEFPYYFITLLMASLVHEAGHAVAAAGEDVHINGIGLLLLYALPGAYVDLSKDGVRKLAPFRQLKILCAGVWHNVVLMIIAFGIGISLPTTMSPFYNINSGILVLRLDKNSLARGPKGLNPGDVIDSVNFCPVSNINEWKDCLITNVLNNQVGFCIPEKIVNFHDETIHHSFGRPDGSVECCDHSDGESKLCFELQNDDSSDVGETPMQPYSCLPARVAIEGSTKSCTTSSQCIGEDLFCLGPSIKNSSRFLAISRRLSNGTPTKDVLFLGLPAHLYFSITVTNYVPKLNIFSPWLPYFLEVLTDYIVKFSGALGLMNLVPCIYLDGYWISGAVIDLFFGRHFDLLARRIIHIVVTVFGTSLLLVTVGLGIWNIL